jgi:CHAD domain-containing protein
LLAYQFTLSDPDLLRGAKRIALEQVKRALTHIERPSLPQPEAVHELRKHAKRLRALLRLIGSATDAATIDALDARLRDAARAVAHLRDADVLHATLAALSPADLPRLSAALARPRTPALSAPEALSACHAQLTHAKRALKALPTKGNCDAILHEGLATTYARARHAQRAALSQTGAARLHDWRKCVKDHLYQARLLTPIWPALMLPHAEATEELAETLGDLNDLAVFRATLATLDLPTSERTTVEARITTLEARHQLAAFPLGARLFVEHPDDLARRWGRLWDIWRA